jgi:hypothetical protein
MEKQIEKILEKYGIDTYHWKLEIAKEIASLYEGWYPPKDIRQIKERYITAHCNPDFKGDKMKFIFDNVEGK